MNRIVKWIGVTLLLVGWVGWSQSADIGKIQGLPWSSVGKVAGGTPAAANGYVGNNAAVVDSVSQRGNSDIPHSHFVASATGTVTYIYVRQYNAGTTMTWLRPGIWNSDGSALLATAADCSPTNPSAGLFRYTISSPITVTAATTYTLGYATTDTNYYPAYSGTGAIYIETGTESLPLESCPASLPAAVTHDNTFTTSGSLCIWASNNPDES
jgi:hypothetical protein